MNELEEYLSKEFILDKWVLNFLYSRYPGLQYIPLSQQPDIQIKCLKDDLDVVKKLWKSELLKFFKNNSKFGEVSTLDYNGEVYVNPSYFEGETISDGLTIFRIAKGRLQGTNYFKNKK